MIGGQVDWPVAAGTRGWFGQSSKLSITDYRGEIVKQGKKKQNKRKKKKHRKTKKKKKNTKNWTKGSKDFGEGRVPFAN